MNHCKTIWIGSLQLDVELDSDMNVVSVKEVAGNHAGFCKTGELMDLLECEHPVQFIQKQAMRQIAFAPEGVEA